MIIIKVVITFLFLNIKNTNTKEKTNNIIMLTNLKCSIVLNLGNKSINTDITFLIKRAITNTKIKIKTFEFSNLLILVLENIYPIIKKTKKLK